MSFYPAPSDLLNEFHAHRQTLWESLSLLSPSEWELPAIDGDSPGVVLATCLADDAALVVALSSSPAASPGPGAGYERLMEAAVETAQWLEERLQTLDAAAWQDSVQGPDGPVSLAGWVAAVNTGYASPQAGLDAYLGSFERLGKQGLKGWLLRVYNAIMDSVAGMTDDEIMGPAWHGDWNTYQILEHIWSWNEQILDIARHWGQNPVPRPLRPLPIVGERNRHLGKVYDGGDMVAVADAIVTVYRKTAQLIERSDPALLLQVDDYPWPGRGPLCNLIFDAYRHAYAHALEIRRMRRRRDTVTR